MDQQWQSYSETTGSRQSQYSQSTPQQQMREPASSSTQQQHPQNSTYNYEAYQTPSLPSHPHSIGASPITTPQTRTFTSDGDVPMEDADPYNRMKYPSRPNHQHRASGQYLSQEDTGAARKYSPMKTLSPSSPYASPHQSNQPYSSYTSQNTSARQSPTRPNIYNTPSQNYYGSPCKS